MMVSEDNALRVTMVLMAIATADAAFLTYAHYQIRTANVGGVCFDAPGIGCGSVLESAYSEVVGIPLALIGLVGFAVILALAIARYLYTDKGFTKNLRLPLLLFTSIGVGVAIYCTYLEFFVLYEICPYCMLAHVMIILTALVMFIAYKPYLRLLYGDSTREHQEILEWSPEEE
jgi:uncharacterized membrane protein